MSFRIYSLLMLLSTAVNAVALTDNEMMHRAPFSGQKEVLSSSSFASTEVGSHHFSKSPMHR